MGPKPKTKQPAKGDAKAKGASKAAAAVDKALKVKKVITKGAHLNRKRKIRTKPRFRRPVTFKADRTPRYSRKSVPGRNKLDAFKIIQYPLTTESAMKKIEDNNTLVFVVDKRSNKATIQKSIKQMYDIEAVKINTLIRPDGLKKAYVKLTSDYDALDVANKINII